jgi:glycosyltransferase involved in cell wall biosynthesis
MSDHWLLCTTFLPPLRSGSGSNTLAFAKYLKNNGVQVSILSFYKKNEQHCTFFERMRYLGIQLPAGSAFEKLLFRITFPFRFVFFAMRCKTVYIIGVMPGYTMAIVLARLMRKRVLFRSALLNGDDPLSLLRDSRGLKRVVIGGVLRMVSKYVAINKAFYSSWLSAFPNRLDKVMLAVQGVDTDMFAPVSRIDKLVLKEGLGLPSADTPIILSVGNLTFRKGYASIFRALAEISSPFIYVVVGESNPDSPYYFWGKSSEIDNLRNLGKQLLGDNLVLTGYQSDVAAYYKCADIYVSYADQEGFPNAIMEAMSSSVPVVCRPIRGATDWLLTNDVCAHCNSESDLTVLLDELLRNPLKRELLASNSRQVALRYFSFDYIFNLIG